MTTAAVILDQLNIQPPEGVDPNVDPVDFSLLIEDIRSRINPVFPITDEQIVSFFNRLTENNEPIV